MRYIVLPVITHRNIMSYAVIDTATGARVRSYDCELWANHEAKELNTSQTRPEVRRRRLGIVEWYLSVRDKKKRREGI